MTFGDKIDREKRVSFYEGQKRILIKQICKKLTKGMSISEIADDLETDEAEIARICEVADKFAPEYDQDAIFEELEKKTVYN